MSNPEKMKMDTEEESNESSEESDYLWSDEEGEFRDLVLALPAMRVSERLNVDDQEVQEEDTLVAQMLRIATEEDAATTNVNRDQTVGGPSENTKRKKVGRPRKVRLDVAVDGASGSVDGGEAAKKQKKKGSALLKHPPQGPPTCNICGRGFVSWKAVFGHLRSHKDRGYQGFLPPPTFNAVEEVGASSRSGRFGGLEIDLNVEPMESEEGNGSGTTPKFDLNSLPPQEEEEEKDDKAE